MAAADRSLDSLSRWKLLLLLCAADFMAYVAIFSVPPVLGEVARHFGVDYERAGLMMTAYSVVRTAGSLAAGIYSDRFGVKRFVLAGLGLVATAGYFSAHAPSFGWLLGCRVLIGMGATMVFIPGLAAAIHLLPRERVNLASGSFLSSLYLGMSVALLATPILAARMGWPRAFELYAAVTVAVGVLFLLLTRGESLRNAPDAAVNGSPRSSVRTLAGKALLLASGVYFLFLFQTYGLLTWLPEYLKVVRQYTPPEVGSVSMLLGVVLIPGSVFAGWLSDRVGAWGVAVAGSLICAVCPVLLVMFPAMTIGQVSAVVFWKAVGTSMIAVPLAGLLAHLVPASDSGKAVGLAHTAGYAGSIVSTYLGGYLLNRFGNYDWSFGIFAVSMIVNVGLLTLLRGPFRSARAALHGAAKREAAPARA
ncbi:MAG TPA: MFS transporter [Terriglobales bacterium]|nr:MFS transporter [Terriglobales bacterium]